MIKIIIADDHALVRAGIGSLLKQNADMEIIAETGSGKEAVRLCGELKPDVILLDLNMPELDGLEATKQITAASPDVSVLILTMHENEEYAIRTLKAGASGFIVKGVSPEELPEAIRTVAAGEVYISPPIMKKISMRQIGKNATGDENLLNNLSDREFQVFTGLARGLSLNEIGNELGVSASAIGTYKSRVMEKLKLRNNADLVRLAIREGLSDKFD